MTCNASPSHLSCTACPLHQTRTHVVPGHGNFNASIALIGEGPGANEDREGKPFVGRAGVRLDMLLTDVGLERSGVWLDNLIGCQPPENNIKRAPAAVAACPSLWLLRTLDKMPRLKVIVAMGFWAGGLWFPGYKATQLSKLARRLPDGKTVIGSFHPSYAMREGEWVDESIRNSFRRAIAYAAL